MSLPRTPRLAPVALLAFAVAVAAPAAGAQAVDRTVRGQVTTSDGVPIFAAAVWVVDTAAAGDSSIAATTGADGRYRFNLPLRPTSAILVHRLGFRARRAPLGDLGKRTIDVAPIALESVSPPAISVAIRDSGAFTGPSAQFFRHLASGRGQYVTASQLARSSSRTSNALRLIPGLILANPAAGGTVKLRGRSCYVAIWIDNAPLGSRAFDVDAIPANTLIGIEFYGNGMPAPMEYQTPEGVSCGVLAFWTRRTELLGMPEPATVHEQATVRLASEVDRPARLGDSVSFAPRYPDEARAAGIGGQVIVELVVDTLGFVERSSVSVAAAAAPELADPAAQAATRLRFVPAMVHGVAVRQLVHLVARFESSHSSNARGRSGR
jgi:TonB family protein